MWRIPFSNVAEFLRGNMQSFAVCCTLSKSALLYLWITGTLGRETHLSHKMNGLRSAWEVKENNKRKVGMGHWRTTSEDKSILENDEAGVCYSLDEVKGSQATWQQCIVTTVLSPSINNLTPSRGSWLAQRYLKSNNSNKALLVFY